MNEPFTVVYRGLTSEERSAITADPKAVWFGWCHAPHERDAARAAVEAAQPAPTAPAQAEPKLTHIHRADPEAAAKAHRDATAAGPSDAERLETQVVLIEGIEYTVPIPVAAEMLRLHLEVIDDTERLNWIELAATRRKVEIARSILGAGYEIGEWPSMRVTVKSGTLRDAIDAAIRAAKGGKL